MGISISVNKSKKLTKGEQKVLDALKNAYAKEKHKIFLYVQPTLSKKRPDFIIIDAKRGILILEVKDWSENYIKEVDKRRVTLLDDECDNPIMQVKGYKNILNSALFNRDFKNIDEDDIHMGIVFTNLNKSEKVNRKLELLFNKYINYTFKEELSNIELDNLFNNNRVDFSGDDLNSIRIALFPEIEIINDEEVNKKVDLKALDFEQEKYAKKIPLGNYMVTGIPGSGKTVILLARAIYLIKENPNWRVLILTYNKSLSYKLINRLNRLAKVFKDDVNNKDINIDNIEIRHFHDELKQLIGSLKVPEGINKSDWFNKISIERANEKATQQYDAILIDEYQDFRMNWIELCVKLCKDYYIENDKVVKNIFLAGDRLQSIYNNKDISWKSIGIDMRGRSDFLKISYRSAKQHMALALDFLKNDSVLKAEVDKFYKDDSGDKELNALNNGSLEFITADFSEISTKILELKEQGYENKDILILGASERVCKNIKACSSPKIKYEMKFVKDLEPEEIDNNIVLTTYHSSKGLEAKVVMLTTIDKIYSNENEQLKRKVAYVGITRASEKLFVFSQHEEEGKFLKELKELSLVKL